MAKKGKHIVTYIDRPCNPACSSRLNGVCIRTPAIGLVSDKVYNLRNSNDPSSGEYLNESPITTTPPRFCPFTKPQKCINGKVTRDDDEHSLPGNHPTKEPDYDINSASEGAGPITLLDLTPIVASAGKEGVIALSVFYASLGIMGYMSSETPQVPIPDQLSRYATNFKDTLKPYIDDLTSLLPS